MKHTALALLLSIGLLAPGCAHRHTRSSAHHVDGATALVLLGVAAVGLAIIVAGQVAGTKECEDPLGRCGSYDLR